MQPEFGSFARSGGTGSGGNLQHLVWHLLFCNFAEHCKRCRRVYMRSTFVVDCINEGETWKKPAEHRKGSVSGRVSCLVTEHYPCFGASLGRTWLLGSGLSVAIVVDWSDRNSEVFVYLGEATFLGDSHSVVISRFGRKVLTSS